jgi:predicted amino acid racemase
MATPRLEINLRKIKENAHFLAHTLGSVGINVTGVTKAVCGHPDIAKAILEGGVKELADSRISNITRMRLAGIECPISMIRSPLLSEINLIVRHCETSYNTEIAVIEQLGAAARILQTTHNVILMVDMGDLREGITPKDLNSFILKMRDIPGISLMGIGTNFACLSGLPPSIEIMNEFSLLTDLAEGETATTFKRISGGNSANLPWAIHACRKGRTNDLRIGEAILLGVEPVSGEKIEGLHTDAFVLIAEVIESKIKPIPTDHPLIAAGYLGKENISSITRSILGLGKQDTDPEGLEFPDGINFSGVTSDHIVVIEKETSSYEVGSEIHIRLNYSALARAMSAPDILKSFSFSQ